MSSADDDAYAAFLDKANQPTSKVSTASKSDSGKFPRTQAVSQGEEPPASLREVDATFTSEADEPFEAVTLKFDGDTIDGASLSKAIGHHSDAEEVELKKFDSRGEYAKVIDAVKGAGKGDVKVFRVQGEGARVEYWVVALDGQGRLVGVKARAVES